MLVVALTTCALFVRERRRSTAGSSVFVLGGPGASPLGGGGARAGGSGGDDAPPPPPYADFVSPLQTEMKSYSLVRPPSEKLMSRMVVDS